jgi:two-component system invasion response regulator UvrY
MRVLIVDDHVLLRRSVRALLTDRIDGVVVDEAANGEDAVRRVAAEPFDVVLLDLSLGRARGFDTLRAIRGARTGVSVLVMSMHPEEQYGAAARAAGAAAYIVKGSPPDAIVQAIRSACPSPPG